MSIESGDFHEGDQKSPQESITILSSFICDSCSSGSEKYHEVFCNGTCNGCGAPVKEFEATITEVGLDLLKKSVLVVSHKEIDEQVDEIIAVLDENGINVMKAIEIVEGTKIGQAAENLAFVSRNAAYTFFVISENLNTDQVTNVLLGDLLFGDHDEVPKIVPVYINEDSYKHIPSFLIDRRGVNWNGSEEHRNYGSRERTLTHIKAELGKE